MARPLIRIQPPMATLCRRSVRRSFMSQVQTTRTMPLRHSVIMTPCRVTLNPTWIIVMLRPHHHRRLWKPSWALGLAAGLKTPEQNSILPTHDAPQAMDTPIKPTWLRLLHRLHVLLDTWVLEPLLTLRRLAHITILFIPVVVTAPTILWGKINEEGDRLNALWWYDLLSTQMERAGPTFIKLSQWIASRTDLFPLALCTRLSKLHSQVDPHPFAYTRRVIEQAFGRPLESVFAELDETPVGVGAIAQVYMAKIRLDHLSPQTALELQINDHVAAQDAAIVMGPNGEPIQVQTSVAVKILHPKARQLVCRDLKIMSFFAKMLSVIPTMYWLSLPEEVEVFGNMMLDQLDLRVEAENLRRFNENFKESLHVGLPKPLMRYTTSDMLLEEFEKGIPLAIFLQQASYAKKHHQELNPFDKKIATIGLDAFLHMLIFHNFVHADLHPGNILVKFYKPTAYHPAQQAWSRLTGRRLTDDGEAAVNRVMEVRNDHDQLVQVLNSLEKEGYALRLVFVDAGLVNELNDNNRRNFIDLFSAIAHFDGYRAGELMVERCRTPELVKDPKVFALEMQNLILGLKQNTFNLGVVKIGNLLHEAMNMVRSHHVKMEGDFVNVVVSTMLLEGIGRQLDPDLDLFKSAIRVLRDYSIKDGGKMALEGLKDAKEHKSAPHWVKVWVFLELRHWLSRNTRDEEWLQLCDILCVPC